MLVLWVMPHTECILCRRLAPCCARLAILPGYGRAAAAAAGRLQGLVAKLLGHFRCRARCVHLSLPNIVGAVLHMLQIQGLKVHLLLKSLKLLQRLS